LASLVAPLGDSRGQESQADALEELSQQLSPHSKVRGVFGQHDEPGEYHMYEVQKLLSVSSLSSQQSQASLGC